MNPIPEHPILIDAAGNEAEPLYFRPGARSLFGWLHRAQGAAAPRVGVVLCKPFGYEAICAHRSLRAFAEQAAAAGAPVLRFDYAGTGNSQDLDPGADQLQTWTEDAVGAAQELLRLTGVAQVCFLGFRLGAVIAAQAALRGTAGTSLIAVAPIQSGARYLRELRTTQLAADAQVAKTADESAAAPADESGSMHISGFSLSGATVAALSQVELLKIVLPPVRDLLIIDRKELPAAKAWSDALAQGGTRVQYQALPGFVRMMMTAPHFSVVPQAMITATCDWLRGLQHEQSEADQSAVPAAAPVAHSTPSDACNTLKLPYGPAAEFLTESAMLLGADVRLFAVVTEPAHGETRRRGVILLNAGATHHVGPNRMYVTLARRCAVTWSLGWIWPVLATAQCAAARRRARSIRPLHWRISARPSTSCAAASA
jgi:alpha/beta superfamily hydrolase